jgi:photosystem II stability/assembly factor-like uncharacterized protein
MSTNGGTSWQKLTISGVPNELVKIEISPDYANDRMLLAATSEGLYYSRNAGLSWQQFNSESALDNGPVITAVFSPNFSLDGIILASVKGVGLFKSTDSGNSWSSNGSLIDTNHLLEKIVFSDSFATDSTIFATSLSDGNIYKSVDGALSWLELARPVRYEDNNPSVYRSGGWRYKMDMTSVSGGRVSITNIAGSRMALYFNGTSISVIGPKSPALGIANVYIDGSFKGSFDQYNSELVPMDTLLSITGLQDGEHRIMIEVLGEKNPEASNNYIAIDAFDIEQ